MLGRRSIEPDRPTRLVGAGMPTRLESVLCMELLVLSAIFSLVTPSDSRILPWPVGEGNWVNLKSVDADSKLLCRSSKLTEGKKS